MGPPKISKVQVGFEFIFPQQSIHIYKIIFGGGGKLIFNNLKFMYAVNCGKLQS